MMQLSQGPVARREVMMKRYKVYWLESAGRTQQPLERTLIVETEQDRDGLLATLAESKKVLTMGHEEME